MENKPLSEKSKRLREKWNALVKQWQESKLSQQAYCDQAGLKYKSFIYWRCKLLTEQQHGKKPDFIPVKIIPDHKAKPPADCTIQIKTKSGHLVILPTSLGLEKSASLIRMLEDC